MKQGVSVSNGTDCPVELPDALASMECAVTRTTIKDHVGPIFQMKLLQCRKLLTAIRSVGQKEALRRR